MKPVKPVRKWILRFLAVFFAVLLMGGVGFEIWRQIDIDSAEDTLARSRAQIDPALPGLDAWRAANIGPSDGTQAFEDFLLECHNYGAEFPDNPADRISFSDRSPWEGDAVPTQSELTNWLTATDHLAQGLAGAAKHERIILDPRNPGLEFRDYRMSTLWLYGLTSADIPYDRVLVLHYLGRNSEALAEYRCLHKVTLALRQCGSAQQLWLLALFNSFDRRAALELAIDDILVAEDLRDALKPEPDWTRLVAQVARLTIARVRDDGTASVVVEGEDARYKGGWFSWLNPGNYEDYDSQELTYSSLAYAYERRGVAQWLDYTAGWVDAADTVASLPEAPSTPFFEGRLLRWSDNVRRLAGPAAHAEMLDCVVRLRLGEEPHTYSHIETQQSDHTWTLTFKHTKATWKALAFDQTEELPSADKFFEEYSPLKIVRAK
jgi:hypothetical protein